MATVKRGLGKSFGKIFGEDKVNVNTENSTFTSREPEVIEKVVEKVVVEYAGGQVDTETLVAKAKEVSGKKSIKELNVYYQPENGVVYFTVDGVEGKFNL